MLTFQIRGKRVILKNSPSVQRYDSGYKYMSWLNNLKSTKTVTFICNGSNHILETMVIKMVDDYNCLLWQNKS